MGTGFQNLIRGLGWVILLAGLTLSGGLPLAQAGTWVYQKIADDQMFDPQSVNGAIRFSSFGEQPAISGDTVYFYGESDRAGLRSWSPTTGIVNQLVTGDLLPDGASTFTAIDPAFAFDGDDFAFAGHSGNQQGIYARVGGQLRSIADLNTPIPSGNGNFSGFRDPFQRRAVRLHQGTVAFVGNGDQGQQGLFLADSTGLHRVADRSTPFPGLGTNFSAFSDPWISGGRVLFTGYAPPGPLAGGASGIFAWSSATGIQPLFTSLEPIPRPEFAGSRFSFVGSPSTRAGETLFTGIAGNSYVGVFSVDGAAPIVHDSLTGFRDRAGDIQSLVSGPIHFAIFGEGLAISAATGAANTIIWNRGGDWTQVLGPGDVLDGLPVLREPDPQTEPSHEFRLGPSGFANDTLAFYSRAGVAVGSGPGVAIVREGVYLAIQVPEPASHVVLTPGLLLVVVLVYRKRGGFSNDASNLQIPFLAGDSAWGTSGPEATTIVVVGSESAWIPQDAQSRDKCFPLALAGGCRMRCVFWKSFPCRECTHPGIIQSARDLPYRCDSPQAEDDRWLPRGGRGNSRDGHSDADEEARGPSSSSHWKTGGC